ncbi:MAG: sporulation protein [Phaeodactylibacter sp.]|nr:sporulation protein [Phaeodactylibacter sp.]
MIGRVKKWLGIEGVKLELLLPEELEGKSSVLEGRVRLESLNPQVVRSIRIILIERYSRGRGAEKLVDEYELGRVELPNALEVLPGEIRELPFKLPFELVQSNMDGFGKRNFLFGGLAKAAKAINAVSSEFRVEAEAEVEGVALNPFDKKAIAIKG